MKKQFQDTYDLLIVYLVIWFNTYCHCRSYIGTNELEVFMNVEYVRIWKSDHISVNTLVNNNTTTQDGWCIWSQMEETTPHQIQEVRDNTNTPIPNCTSHFAVGQHLVWLRHSSTARTKLRPASVSELHYYGTRCH